MAGGGKNAGDAFVFAELVVPNDFSSAIVERANGRVGPEVAIAAAPAFGFAGDGIVVNAEDAARVDIEEVCLRVEAR